MKEFVVITTSVIFIVVGLFCAFYFVAGGFATDKGLYMETSRFANIAIPDGFIYHVKMERKLGADRILYKTWDETEAQRFMLNYPAETK